MIASKAVIDFFRPSTDVAILANRSLFTIAPEFCARVTLRHVLRFDFVRFALLVTVT
jgi:hypothetical protein